MPHPIRMGREKPNPPLYRDYELEKKYMVAVQITKRAQASAMS